MVTEETISSQFSINLFLRSNNFSGNEKNFNKVEKHPSLL